MEHGKKNLMNTNMLIASAKKKKNPKYNKKQKPTIPKPKFLA